MRLNIPTVAALALVAAGLSRPLAAQSLADVARQEEERRKSVKTPAKVITNKDLTAVPPIAPVPAQSAAPSTPAPSTPVPSTPVAGTTPAADAREADKPGDSNEPVKDQAYWSARMLALRTQLERDETHAGAMQTQVNSLTTDLVNRDDPAQRAVLERDRQKALSELSRLKEAIQAGKKAIADLEEEARRAGVPPGWLR